MRDDTPVLIGAGQFTIRGKPENSPSALELLKIAAERAVCDAGLSGSVLAELHALAVIAFSIDAPGGLSRLPLPRLANPPASLARAVGASPGWSVYAETSDDITETPGRWSMWSRRAAPGPRSQPLHPGLSPCRASM